MANGYDNNWMTTFIYKQDIRSYIFNNLLFSVVKSGVYNADVSIGVSSEEGANSLNLTLKKGTTLIFTNDYVKNSISNKYERNWEGIAETSENINISLIKCVARTDYTTKFTIGEKTSSSDYHNISINDTKEPLFVIAYFRYNSEEENTNVLPRFGIFKKATSIESKKKSYFERVYADSGIEITEGTSENITSSSSTIMYLILGVIEPASNTAEYSLLDETWFQQHTFTCKGLPEYRYPMINTKNIPSSDVLLSYDINNPTTTLYVDWERALVNGEFYNRKIDWRTIYLDETAFSLNGTNSLTGQLDGEGLSLSDSENTLIKENASAVVLDFIFAKTVNTINNVDSSSDYLYSLDFSDSPSNDLPLGVYRYIDTSFSSNVLDTKHYTTNSDGNYTLWLDKGITNKKRLLSFLENRGNLKKIINNIRQKNLVDNYNSIIPVAIAIRRFSDNDGFTSRGTVNPSNVLCLLDIASEDKNINKIDSYTADINNIITIL